MNLAMNAESMFALFIALGCFFIPIIILTIIVIGKMIYKATKKNKQTKNGLDGEIKYISYFGGDNNIVNVSKDMTRVTVEVKDLEMVDFEQLRSLGVGILIAGNIVKCSSQVFADQIENV